MTYENSIRCKIRIAFHFNCYCGKLKNEITFVVMAEVKEQGGFKFKTDAEGRMLIFDSIRNKFVVNTPEEWVRQNTVKYIHEELGYPKSLIALEKQFMLHKRTKRTDIMVHDLNGNPIILVECKRPSIRITQSTFDQAFRYNIVLKVPYLMLTNGEEVYCCHVDGEKVNFINEFPNYQNLLHG